MTLVLAPAAPPAPRRAPATVTGRAASPLTAVCFDAWLLASHGAFGDGIPEGRAWERAVAELLVQPGMTRRQGPGGTTMLGMPSASGCGHELDGVADGWRGMLITECKARSHGIAKADVATFEAKTFDFYTGNLERAAPDRWWRILVSATALPAGLRRMCFCGGTVLVDPEVLPLPVLTWTAGSCNADITCPSHCSSRSSGSVSSPTGRCSSAGCPTVSVAFATTRRCGPTTSSTTSSTCKPSCRARCLTFTTVKAITAHR